MTKVIQYAVSCITLYTSAKMHMVSALEITQAKSRRQPLKMHLHRWTQKMHDLECMSCYCHGNTHKIPPPHLKYHIKLSIPPELLQVTIFKLQSLLPSSPSPPNASFPLHNSQTTCLLDVFYMMACTCGHHTLSNFQIVTIG